MADFVYPYNFVSRDNPPKELLPFKPHHRFDGLTGRIRYKIKNISPLFIPDPEGTTVYKIGSKEADTHHVMDFFNVKDRLCIPPTSIKGMLRSVFEAVTNSTFGVIDLDDVRYSFRKAKDFRNYVGVYQEGQIIPHEIAKLPLDALKRAISKIEDIDDYQIDEETIKKYANEPIRVTLWKIHTGMRVVVRFELKGRQFEAITTPNIRQLNANNNGRLDKRPRADKKRQIDASRGTYHCPWDHIQHGSHTFRVRVFDKINKDSRWTGPVTSFKTYSFYSLNQGNDRVVEIVVGQGSNQHIWRADDNSGPFDGRLLLQRFYLDEDVRESEINRSDKYVYVLCNPTNAIPISDEVIRNYRDVNERIEKPHPLNKLRDGMVVYYRINQSNQVAEFGPVAIFKSAENASLKEIIETHSSHLIPPTTAQKLCPATRLFGWTPESDEAKEQGVAGRVRFSPAWGNKTLKDTVLIPLKILGGPRPKYYPFYLKPVNPSESSKSAYYTLNADPPFSATRGKIRGQKFYLHHPKACKKGIEPTDYIKKETDADNPAFTNQNSTCAVLPAGDTLFEGYIEFESLDAYELGALLWCITLSDNPKVSSPNHAHKLGKGKGIGMGSVQFEITDIEIFNPQDNWFSLNSTEPIDLQKNSIMQTDGAEFIEEFKQWLSDSNRFEDLPQINDLLILLSKDIVRDQEIMYRDPNYNHDEGFKYFMEQRKKRVVRARENIINQEQPLRTPAELKDGRTQRGDNERPQRSPHQDSRRNQTRR